MRQIITSLQQTFGAIATQLVQHQSQKNGSRKGKYQFIQADNNRILQR